MQQHNLNQQQPQLSLYQQNMASPYGKPSSCFWDSSLEKHEQRQQPMFSRCASVLRRNARERNRVKQLNNGFSLLRQQIPVAIIAELSNGRRGIGRGANKMLSKVNILRMAVEYIRRLQRTIDENDQKQQQQQQQHQQQQHQQQQQQLHWQQQQQQQQQQLHWQQQPQQPTHQQQHCNYQQQFHQQQQQQSYALQHQWQLNSSSGSCCSTTSNTSSCSASALPSCCYHM